MFRSASDPRRAAESERKSLRLSMRMQTMIPYDLIAVFGNRNGWILPEGAWRKFTHAVLTQHSRRRMLEDGGRETARRS